MGVLADYRLYFIDREGHITSSEEFVCPSDGHAVAEAQRRRAGVAAELWRRADRVRTFEGAPSSAAYALQA